MAGTAALRGRASPTESRLGFGLLRVGRRTFGYLLLIAVAAVTVLPFLWMVLGAFKDQGQLYIYPPKFIPKPWDFSNFGKVAAAIPLGIMLFNSVKITVLATLGALLSSSLAAYGFSRLHFFGRDKLFLVLLATMMIPGQVTMIPVFLVMRQLGWINTHYPLIVPDWFGWAFAIFLLRQFFLTISSEIEDAAKIDGANPFQIYRRIFIPLSRPALATLAVFAFMGNWNDLLRPVIYLSTFEQMTLTVGLASFNGLHRVDYHLIMAASVISVLPIMVVFMSAQKYFVRGVALSGGLKG